MNLDEMKRTALKKLEYCLNDYKTASNQTCKFMYYDILMATMRAYRFINLLNDDEISQYEVD